jgi:hypothetical protein
VFAVDERNRVLRIPAMHRRGGVPTDPETIGAVPIRGMRIGHRREQTEAARHAETAKKCLALKGMPSSTQCWAWSGPSGKSR